MIKVKQSLLKGNTAKQALLDANYSPATAEHSTGMSVVKCSQAEIIKDMQGVITVEMVLKRIDEDRTNANSKGDFSTALQADIALGKYLAMFTDKSENKTTLTDERKVELNALTNRCLGITN